MSGTLHFVKEPTAKASKYLMRMDSSSPQQPSMRSFLYGNGGSLGTTEENTSNTMENNGTQGIYGDREHGNHEYERYDETNQGDIHGYDRYMDKNNGKTWQYSDVRTNRSNSYPMEPSSYRMKDETFHARGTNMLPTQLPRSNSSIDVYNYEVTNGIMNVDSIPEVGNNDTQKHIRSKNLPSSVLFNSGRWSSEEHNRFKQGLEMYPHGVLNRWRKISKTVGTRTVLQTRTHAQKYFRKLSKHNDVKHASDVEDENHLPNESPNKANDRASGRSMSFSASTASIPPKKDSLHHRLSDPIVYDARPLATLNSLSESRPNYSMVNSFPSITIPPPSASHTTVQNPTPTTEASRAFQNISLSGRHPREDSAHSNYPHQQRLGNDQWMDWLLSNIDTVVTRPNNGNRDSGFRMPRAHRSSSEPVPPLHAYRSNEFHPSPQHQLSSTGVWENGSPYQIHGGSSYYQPETPSSNQNEQDSKYGSILDDDDE